MYSLCDEGKIYIVFLEKTCNYDMFHVEKIPFAHACRFLNKNNMLQDEYFSDLFKREIILNTYYVPLYPIPRKSEWNKPKHIASEVVLPLKYKCPPGRTKKQRKKSFRELSKRKGANSCSTC